MADSNKTFAMVVAGNYYDAGKDWALPESQRDAARMLAWLRRHQVPAKQIALFSGEDTEPDWSRAFGGVQWARATEANIKDHLWNYPTTEGDLLVIYWCGHGGTAKGTNEQRVFVSSMLKNRYDNLSIHALQNILETGGFPKLPETVLIVDACSAEEDQLLPPLALPPGGRKGSSGFRAIYAMRGRKRAAAGSLGAVLFPLLERRSWPPDFDALANDVYRECEATQPVATVRVRSKGRDQQYNGPTQNSGRGALTHLRCDRSTPVGRFLETTQQLLSGAIRGPMLCLVYGDDDQRPDSLVARLKAEANLKKGISVAAKNIQWDDTNESHLRSRLSSSFMGEYAPVGPKEFAALLRSAPESLIQVSHKVGDWGPAKKRVLQPYLKFWNELRQEAELPPTLVFFTMRYPRAPWSGWIPWPGGELRVFEQTLGAHQSACPCLTFGPAHLEPIQKSHVEQFVEEHDLDGQSLLDELYPPQGRLASWLRRPPKTHPMSTVERRLEKLMKEASEREKAGL